MDFYACVKKSPEEILSLLQSTVFLTIIAHTAVVKIDTKIIILPLAKAQENH